MKYLVVFIAVFGALLYGASLWHRLPPQHRPKIAIRVLWVFIPMLVAGLCVLAMILLATNGASVRLI